MINRCSVIFFMSLILFTVQTKAEPIMMSNSSQSLGAVNGRINDGFLYMSRTLSQPLIASIKRSELAAPLSYLLLNRSRIIKNQQGEVAVLVNSTVNGHQLQTVATLSVWVDGKKSNAVGVQEGDSVRVNIEQSFETLELRVSQPIEIKLPKHFKGQFSFDLDVEGHS